MQELIRRHLLHCSATGFIIVRDVPVLVLALRISLRSTAISESVSLFLQSFRMNILLHLAENVDLFRSEVQAFKLADLREMLVYFSKKGVDVVFDVPRIVIGPKGLSPEQIKYWDGVFQRVIKTPAWKDALDKNQWDEDYMNSAELGKYLKSQHTILKDVLGELGMVKQ